MFSRLTLALGGLGLLGFGLVVGSPQPATAAAGINQQLNFQGRLLNAAGAVVADGTYNMRFKIYQDGTGCVSGGSSPCSGTLKWTETWQNSASQGVTVRNGYFSVALGSITAFGSSVDWNQDTLWLSLDIAGTGTGGSPTYDGEMLPFKRLTATPYALQAATASTCTTCVLQAPTSTAQNTISPTTNSVVGLTVNATSGTSAVALAVAQSQTADAVTVTSANTTSTQTNAILVNRSGAGGTTTNGINITNTAGTLTNGLSFTGTIGTDINRSSGTLTIQGAGGVTLSTTNVSGASGAILIQGGNSSAGTAGNVTLDTGTTSTGTPTVNLGNANAKAVQVGNNTSNPSVTIDSGTGTIGIGTGAQARTVNLGTGAAVQTVAVGSGTSSSTTTIQGGNGTGAVSIQSAASGTIGIGTANAANTVQIGNTANALAQTINIGNNATASANSTVTLGSLVDGSTTTIQGGTGNINLTTNQATAGTIVKTATNNSTTAFQVQNAGSASLLTVDTSGNNLSLLGNNSTLLSTWTTTTAMSVGANTARVRGGAVAANGYLYHIGGKDGTGATIGTVQYAKLGADGTVGTWASTTALPTTDGTGRRQFQPVVLNGYLYVIGGRDNSDTTRDTVFYAKLNADGTVGTWASTTALPASRFAAAATAYNGHIFVFGGFNSGATSQTTVYSIKANPDGTLASAWSTPTALTTAVGANRATVANGYVYLAGGYTTGYEDDIYYAKLNTDGTVGSWNAVSSALNSTGGGDEDLLQFVSNGYLYVVGGDLNDRVVAFPLNSDGTLGTVVALTDFPLNPVGEAGAASANGYFYILGGSTSSDGGGTARSTVYYAGGPRIKVGGSLDLVNYGSENLAEGGTGGQLTAGNTMIVGTLQVQDAVNFNSSLSVSGALRVADALAVGGTATFKSQTNSTGALVVQNSSGTTLLQLDSTGSNQNNLISNPSFETNTTGWAIKGATPTISRDTTQYHSGVASLKVVTQATANQGTKYDVTLSNSTKYALSFYAKLDSGSFLMSSVLAAGYSSDGSTDNTACTLNTSTVISNGWTHVLCTFTTPSSNSGTPYIYIKQTNGVVHTFYIDGVTLQTDTNAEANYRESKFSLNGVVTTPLQLQNSSNSMNAFRVQDTVGTDILNVDTTTANMVTNANFESNLTGWAVEQGTGSVNRDASQAWMGDASLNVTTSSTANAGAKFTTGSSAPTALSTVSDYTVSWYAKLSSGTFTDIRARYSPDGGSTFVNCSPSDRTVVTSGWKRFSCTFNTGATSVTSGAYIAIVQEATGTARTFYVDGVQLESGTTASTFDSGTISFNGVVTSPVIMANRSDSATAFQVQDAAMASLFTIDTTARSASGGNLIKIGNSTGTDTALTILQLDAASAAPTSNLSALNGGLFYNSSTGKVNIIEGGAVKVVCNTTDLGCGSGGAGTLQASYTASTGSTTPEILLDTTRNGLDVQDANTTIGATVPLLAVRASATASTLGNILFDVQGNGRVGINMGGASTTASYDLSFGNGANRTIGVEGSASGAGKSLTIQGGLPTGTSAGGSAILLGGSSYGASFTAKGSSSTAFDDTGGDADITGGSGGGTGGGLLRVGGSFFNSNLGTTDGGNILLQAGADSGGGIPGMVTVKNGGNYATAFQVQNTSSLAVLTADTSGLAVQIGLATTDANAVELIVDGYNGTSDPTGANGAIYYNTGGRSGAGGTSAYTGTFRCFEGNVWKNCVGMRDIVERRWAYLNTAGTAPTAIYPTGMDIRNEVGTIAASKQTESMYIRYTNGGSGTDGGLLGGFGSTYTETETRYLPKYTTRLRVDVTSVGASTRYWVGLFESTPMGFDPPTTSAAQSVDYIGVGYRDNVNSAKWLCASGDGTNHTGTDTGVTVTANHYYDIIIDLSTAGTLVCSISDNGGAFTTVTKTTNLPGTSVDLGLVEATRSVSAVTRAISIAYGYLEYQ